MIEKIASSTGWNYLSCEVVRWLNEFRNWIWCEVQIEWKLEYLHVLIKTKAKYKLLLGNFASLNFVFYILKNVCVERKCMCLS